MCGIAGFEVRVGSVPERAGALLDGLAARGPDGGSWEQHGSWCLVQTRLAVVDLSAAVRYPMGGCAGSGVRLVFNGEVYDHARLREELSALGHRFRTTCDAEVVVHGYEQWGLGVLGRLNAMFALALHDARTDELLLARDARGIKPLVHTTRGPLAFGSDAVALVRAGLTAGEVDPEAVAEFLAFHYVPEPRTGQQGLEVLAPGTALRVGADGAREVHRWDRPVFRPSHSRAAVSIDQAEDVVRRAVQRQLVADVPVGVFLSGGLDSALVLHYATELGARPHAFTVAFAGAGDYDESAAAAGVAARLGVPHHVARLEVDFPGAMAGLAGACDVPLADESMVATLPLAALAREHVTVALSGTGGDDLFAGYYRHRAPAVLPWLRRAPAPLLRRLAALPVERGAERRSGPALARSYAVRLARLASAGGQGAAHYLELVGSSTSAEVLAATRVTGLAPARRDVGTRLGLDGTSLDEIQEFELRSYLPGCILVKEDRASMARGLEARVPLLDAEVVALAAATPAAQRAGLRGGKLLLRELARSRLPWRQGRKRGFAVPVRQLFDGPWRADAVAWLHEGDSELVHGARAAALLDRPEVAALEVWGLCALQAWELRLRAARAAGARLRAVAAPA